MRCSSFCTAANYQLSAMVEFFKNQGYFVQLSRNVLHISQSDPQRDIFLFQHGCFVSWGLSNQQEQTILSHTTPFSVEPLEKVEFHAFVYRIGQVTEIVTHPRLNTDIITLETSEAENPQVKLAISYGLSQSVKLQFYESSIQKTVVANRPITRQLAEHGRISLSRKAIFKRIGGIFLAKSSVNLSSEYLDVSEYFWRHANLESYHIMTEKFLDIPKRVSVLNKRLDVVHDVFVMLNNQLQHRYSSILESVIIFLIFIELLINLVHRHS